MFRRGGEKKGRNQNGKGTQFTGRIFKSARKEKIPVTIYITNGFQFKGLVRGFDNYTVILDTDRKQNLIYKHAISTITPLRAVSILDAFDKGDSDTEVKE